MQLNLSTLSPDKKQFIWHWLKENKPFLAELLTDSQLKEAQTVFGGAIIIELEPAEINDIKKKFAKVSTESV